MSFETLLYEVKDSTALITLNRPEKMNAWNGTLQAELSLALKKADKDNDVRAVVFTGAGRAFCAGADLDMISDGFNSEEDDNEEEQSANEVYPYQVKKPVIAAMNGPTVGVGMTWSMFCDMRIIAEDAKLGFVFVRRGTIPEYAAHLLVQRVAGFSNAADLLLSGRIFLGKEAADMGIANEALPRDQVLPRALEIAAQFRLTAPVSVAITKKLLWEGLSTSLSDMRERENPLFRWTGNQPDAREGVMSFFEKREPKWSMSLDSDLPDFL